VDTLYHFSEDPTIDLFRPHVARTSSETEPLVWALDKEHAPSYWFPRDCPRACCWVGNAAPISQAGAALLGFGGARRLHAIEGSWLEPVRACRLYAYEFDPALFQPKIAEAGYWVARRDVTPLTVSPVGDLLARHVEAEIELRVVRNLWPIIDAIVGSGLEFSIIRKANAQPRLVSK
jgi:hypothetical protein